jgi:hypothetical protein
LGRKITNISLIVGLALAIVGIIVLAIGLSYGYQSGQYLGIILIVLGFIVYAIGAIKEMKPGQKGLPCNNN